MLAQKGKEGKSKFLETTMLSAILNFNHSDWKFGEDSLKVRLEIGGGERKFISNFITKRIKLSMNESVSLINY